MLKDRFRTFVSVHVLFIKNNEILLLLRKNITSDGLYSVVAGHLDGGETVRQAMVREAKEEAGVSIDSKDIKIKTVCHSYSSHNNREFIQFYGVCEKWNGEIKNNEPDKCGELKIKQYYSRVRTPKDNPDNERFNQTLQTEFINLGNMRFDIEEFNKNLTEWLIEYNFERPHQSLNYKTPVEFSGVLPMCSSSTKS